MIIWSIIDESIIINGMENIKHCRNITYQGRQLMVIDNINGECEVVRLISSSPRDYMDSRFQPGAIINIK